MTSTDQTRRSFTLTWKLDAPPETVFDAWTDPARLGWFYNDQQPVPDEPIELDLRVGGEWRQMMVIDEETSYFTGAFTARSFRTSGWSSRGARPTAGRSSTSKTSTRARR
jgi:uncharacterized protein YndB with AHSA1/START domain